VSFLRANNVVRRNAPYKDLEPPAVGPLVADVPRGELNIPRGLMRPRNGARHLPTKGPPVSQESSQFEKDHASGCWVRIWGIACGSIHWTWLIGLMSTSNFTSAVYTSPVLELVEYSSIFGMSFRHSSATVLACRQVGGRADRMFLWTWRGVAWFAAAPRPGAFSSDLRRARWSNVELVPATLPALRRQPFRAGERLAPDLGHMSSRAGINSV